MDASFKTWLRSVPVSKMAYPETPLEKLEYFLWLILGPLHPYVRNVLGYLGYIKKYDKYRPNGRQRFLLGRLAPGVTPQMLGDYLVSKGYGKHFVALKDGGELFGFRYSPDFEHQYHIRAFSDGEVRGHYEYTVEAHPFRHDKEVGF